MPQAEYRRELAAIEASLKTVRNTGEEEVVLLGDHVEGMLEAWQHATKEEKRNLLRMMLDGVYVDTRAKKVVALRVKPAFKPLFRVWLAKEANALVRIGTPDIVYASLGEPQAGYTPAPRFWHQIIG